jgi:hypothetical protein
VHVYLLFGVGLPNRNVACDCDAKMKGAWQSDDDDWHHADRAGRELSHC